MFNLFKIKDLLLISNTVKLPKKDNLFTPALINIRRISKSEGIDLKEKGPAKSGAAKVVEDSPDTSSL